MNLELIFNCSLEGLIPNDPILFGGIKLRNWDLEWNYTKVSFFILT